jgi:hypothetical protein
MEVPMLRNEGKTMNAGDSLMVAISGAEQLPPDVAEFCRRNNLGNDLGTAARLAQNHFQASSSTFQVDTDQDSGEKYVVITIAVPGRSREEVLESYYAFTKEFVRAVPEPSRNIIRLSFDF